MPGIVRILGAHMSIAGGYYKAVEAAAAAGMSTCQLFTKNNNQWRAKPITAEESQRFQDALRERCISFPLSHTSYLLNLASPDPSLWQKSVDALMVELQRAEQLAIRYIVLHPGASMGTSEEDGIAAVVKALNEALQRTRTLQCGVLLETTAGQGSSLGHTFEQLASMLDGVKARERMGICFDTCHVFAAGYPLADARDYRDTLRQFDRLIGINEIKAFHLNDSKRELGSRIDRHEHIGRGKLGVEPFRNLLNDRRFRDVPMYLETAKGTENGEDLDMINLKTLQGLIKSRKLSA